ncbi:MAG: hypothetical protein ACYCXP_08590 [Leptospirillum sp.]
MRLDGPDTWGKKARELRTLLYQRWKECLALRLEGLPSWPEIAARPNIEVLCELERRLVLATGKRSRKGKEAT